MASDHYDNALNSLLKPQEKARLVKVLAEIRKGVEGPHRKANVYRLYEKNCLKHLIDTLDEPHADVINLTLSILGNCCLERIVARESVRKYNLLPHLHGTLNEYNQDAVHGRVFRIIGNMCQHWDRLANTVLEKEGQLQLVAKIVQCLTRFASDDDDGSTSDRKKIQHGCPSEEEEEDGPKAPKRIRVDSYEENCQEKPKSSQKVEVSAATVVMALRALRELTNRTTVKVLIKATRFIDAVATVLIKATPEWLESKKHEDVLDAVLRLLYECSRKYPSYDIILQMQHTKKGNAIPYLGKLVQLSPFKVIEITVNLSEVRLTNYDLPYGDIFRNLVDTLSDPHRFPQGREDPLHRDYLKCLCYLMQHPFIGDVKENLHATNLMPVLLSVLRDYQQPTEVALKNCSIMLSTLRSRYMFENAKLKSMLQQGIIAILSDKLDWIVENGSNIDMTHKYKPQKGLSHRSSRKKSRLKLGKYVACESNFERLDIPCDYLGILAEDIQNFRRFKRSLSPCSDTSSSGPNYSPPSSPGLNVSDAEVQPQDHHSDSDDYSPICSDVEDENAEVKPPVDGHESTHDLSFSSIQDESTQKEADETFAHKKQLTDQIVKLLKVLVVEQLPVNVLSQSGLLMKLLKLLSPPYKSICPTDTIKVLLLVVKRPEYLLGLLQSDFPIIVHRLLNIQHDIICITCGDLYVYGRDLSVTFSKLVDFGCGTGDIAHQLFRASLPVKQQAAAAIPFLTDNKQTLINLMITSGGLSFLTNVLRTSFLQTSFELTTRTVLGLSVMAKKVGVKNPTSFSERSEKVVRLPVDVRGYRLADGCRNPVRFKLDDGSCVAADRDFLSRKSVYFNRLLSGAFKESREEEVRLRGVSSEALRLLVMLLQADLNATDVHKLDVELPVLLDVIILADRYLMEDLCNCIAVSVQYFKLLGATASSIYRWSLQSGTDILRVEAIAYALVCDVGEADRLAMFDALLQTGYGEYVADDIHKLLTRFSSLTRRF